MGRKENKKSISGLLARLKSAFQENKTENTAEEPQLAEIRTPASGRRYHFRVMKKSEYLEKKELAEQILQTAGDMVIDDDNLETLLKNYLSKTGIAVEEPAADEITTEEPIADEIAAEEPAVDEIVTEEPTVDKIVTEEPTVDEIVTEEPIADEIAAEEPAVEKSALDELFADADLPTDEEIEEFVLEISNDTEEESPLEALNSHFSEEFPTPEETVEAADTENPEPIVIRDPSLPLTEASFAEEPVEEELFSEDIPFDSMEAAVSSADDTDIGDLLSALPDDPAQEVISPKETEIKTGSSERNYSSIQKSLDEAPAQASEIDALTEEDLLAAIEQFDETVPTETAAADNTTVTETAVMDTIVTEAADTDTTAAEPLALDEEISTDLFEELLPELENLEPETPDDEIIGGNADEAADKAIDAVIAEEEAADAEKKSLEELLAEEALAGAAAEGKNIDKTDIDLMIAFGMDEQLEKTVGKEEATKYKQTIGERKDDHFKKMHESDRPDTVQKKHAEYVSASQVKEIFSEFKEQYSSLMFRFIGAVFFLLLLFFFENNKLLHIRMPAIFDREQYPFVYTLFDLQLVLLCFAMVRGSILTGIGAIFRGRPVPESMVGFLFLGSMVYTVAVAAMCPMHNLQLYNFPVTLAVIFALCYEYMNLRRKIMSFKIISSKKLKYAIDAVNDRDGGAELAMFSDYIADDPSMFRIKRTSFVDGFFGRMETYPRTQRILRVIIPAALILILAFFASDFMLTGSLYQALSVSYITLLLTLPSCIFIAFSYPMYRASSFAYQRDSAMIGEASLGEYADASIVSFDDKEVFPASGIRFANVKVYGNNRIDHVIYAASSVFHNVGGPLAEVFDTATGELGHSENVDLVRIDPDGIEARVDGGAVLIGKVSFMNRYGYSVTSSESEKAMEETGNASILYIAYDNQITAKLYIQYTVDAEFENILKQLYRQGICVGIKSSDPNINDHLLSCKIKMSKYPVRIIKCAQPKESAVVVDRLSSGIVSKSGAKSLLQTLSVCDRVLNASRTNNIITVVSMLLGMAAMAFFTLSGMPLLSAPLWIALYQLFWIVPVIAVTRYQI